MCNVQKKKDHQHRVCNLSYLADSQVSFITFGPWQACFIYFSQVVKRHMSCFCLILKTRCTLNPFSLHSHTHQCQKTCTKHNHTLTFKNKLTSSFHWTASKLSIYKAAGCFPFKVFCCKKCHSYHRDAFIVWKKVHFSCFDIKNDAC